MTDFLKEDKKTGAVIAYIKAPQFDPSNPKDANMRKVTWPDGTMAFQVWPQEGVADDEAPEMPTGSGGGKGTNG